MNELCNVSLCKTHSHASITDNTEKIGMNIQASGALASNVTSLGYPMLNSYTSHQNAFANSVIIVPNLKSDEYQIKTSLSVHTPTSVESQLSNAKESHNVFRKILNDEKSSISFSSFMESQEKTRRDFNLFCQDTWEKNIEQLMNSFAELCLESIYFHVKCSNDNVEQLVKIIMNLETKTLQLNFERNPSLNLSLSEITLLDDDDFQKILASNSTQFSLKNGDVYTLQGFNNTKQKNIIFFFGLYFLYLKDAFELEYD